MEWDSETLGNCVGWMFLKVYNSNEHIYESTRERSWQDVAGAKPGLQKAD